MKYLEEKILKLQTKVQEQQIENNQLHQEREEKELEMEAFSTQLEERIVTYKNVLDEKQQELEVAKRKYAELVDQLPGINIDTEQCELNKLLKSIKERDEVIETFEHKIGLLSAELLDSTKVISKINNEKDEYMKKVVRDRNDQCCKEVKEMLDRSNFRGKELQEMLQLAENDNILKAQQAFEAIEMLRAYENSEDGLSDALKKIHKLQEHLHQRDQQIHDLVVDLNSTNEVVAENCILRKKLGIPEDECIETKGLLAKQRKYAKINDRLVLKLRASEEMRLQLKIDKNDLRRKLADLELHPKQRDEQPVIETEEVQCNGSPKEIKHCDNCRVQYNVYESLKYCRSCIMKQNSNLCDNCMRNFKISSNENIELIKKITKLEIDHQNVSEENANLRAGLNEILEKLRNFENSSEQMIINPATLEKLLYILNLRNVRNGKEVSREISAVPRITVSLEKVADDDEMMQLKMLVKELSEQNENITSDLDKLKLIEEQYNELVRSSELCDDDKEKLLITSLSRCHEIEMNLKCYERKVNYLKNDNEALNNDLKSLKLEYLALISDVKREVLTKARTMQEVKRREEEVDDELVDVGELNAELQQIRSELNGLCYNILKNVKTIDCDNVLALNVEHLENVQLLENNLTTTFITRQEYEAMKKQLLKMSQKIKDQLAREHYFEQLVKVTQSQLVSQQFLISQFADEEISARHLIVDLQSQSNEKYLLTKTQRDLNLAKGREEKMKMELDQLKLDVKELEQKLQSSANEMMELSEEFKVHESNNVLKIRYLKKTLVDLCNQFSSCTPVYLIADFVKNYVLLLELRKQQELNRVQMSLTQTQDVTIEQIMVQMKQESLHVHRSDIEAKIEVIKYQSSCEYLKKQLQMQESTAKELHNEIARLKMQEVKNSQHWSAIRMLFSDNVQNEVEKIEMSDKETQVGVRMQDTSTNTEVVSEVVVRRRSSVKEPVTVVATEMYVESEPAKEIEIVKEEDEPKSIDYNQLSMESQLKKALILASSRSALLIDIENQLSEAQGRIIGLERNAENRDKRIQMQEQLPIRDEQPKKDNHILSITIATLQNLLLEKDTTLSRYQELLKSERQLHSRTYDDFTDDVKQLKKQCQDWENKLHEKCNIESKLRVELEQLEQKMLEQRKLDVVQMKEKPEPPRVTFSEHDIELRSIEVKLKDAQSEMKKLQQQLKDAHANERQHENTVRDKDLLIKELNLKMKTTIDNYDALSDNLVASNEIDQLREMLEDKDKHIQDLTETLNQFHDDQQKYINDSALNSAEQVHHISADLNRADASNRILKTQLEALKRQITNIQQREKQAREMIKTLKNQLIRRPVISVKGDKRPNSLRDEQLQRKVQELDSELLDVKDELRRQININDNKRAKNAAELGLWDKQKRYQELSEKLKVKLTEKEIDCERMKANLQIAKNNIMRLEKEKTMFENRMKSGRYLSGAGVGHNSFCATCNGAAQRDTPLTSATSETGSSMINDGNHHELINVLKSRIESQQRRIISLELEGKGSNAITIEVERLQDHVTTVESQNIRLEARNIQLQLDVDLLKQNDASERMVRQLKHLENYILVLKDELAQAHGQIGVGDGGPKHGNSENSNHQMEQTILTMKRVVEKLRAENKYLKEVKSGSSANSSSSSSAAVASTATYMNQTDRKKEELYGMLKMENEKMQKKFNEALDKISSLQIELELQQTQQGINVSCPHCTGKNLSELAAQGDADVLSQQLQQKSMLLDKAKMLLTRAAAKEKHLREQVR